MFSVDLSIAMGMSLIKFFISCDIVDKPVLDALSRDTYVFTTYRKYDQLNDGLVWWSHHRFFRTKLTFAYRTFLVPRFAHLYKVGCTVDILDCKVKDEVYGCYFLEHLHKDLKAYKI